MEELKAIMQKFAASGWDLIAVPAQEWLDGKADKDTLVSAIKQADKEKLKEIFVSPDSPFFCMFTIIVVTTFISFFSIFNFGELGENALSFENTYTKIESPIKFQSHKDADGYLLFKTINQKNIALACKKCDKKGNISKNSKGNYIKILKGYKYIDLDSLEVSEQNYTIKVNK